MRNIKLLYILIITTFIVCCQNVDIRKQIKEDYKRSVNFFNSNLVSHFPIELPDSYGYESTVLRQDTLKMAGFGVDKFMLWKTYSLSQYTKLDAKFQNLAKQIYSANDSSLLLVFSYCDKVELEGEIYENLEKPERQQLAKHNVSIATSLPVPLFEIEIFLGNTISGLSDDFKLYVLDSKTGKYIKEEYLQECNCLPEKWKHGYSKGVALSEKQKTIIFWVIVW